MRMGLSRSVRPCALQLIPGKMHQVPPLRRFLLSEQGDHSYSLLFHCRHFSTGLSSSSHYRSSKTSEGASSASEAPTAATVRVEEDRNFALDNFLAGIEAGMTSTQVGRDGTHTWRLRDQMRTMGGVQKAYK